MEYIIKGNGKEFRANGSKELKDLITDLGLDLRHMYKTNNMQIPEYKGYKMYIVNPEKRVWTALLEGDTHDMYHNKHARDILMQIAEEYSVKIDEYINGGDGIDASILSDKFPNYEEEKHELWEEVESFSKHMCKLKEILPITRFTRVKDNHYDLRLKRKLAKDPSMKKMIKKFSFDFDYEASHAHPYYPFHQNRIGVIHGISAAKNFSTQVFQKYNTDIICFHTHTLDIATATNGYYDDYNEKYIYPQKMWAFPSMCKETMEYTDGVPTRQVTGFGFLIFDKVTNNYQIIPIIIENRTAVFNFKVYESRIRE